MHLALDEQIIMAVNGELQNTAQIICQNVINHWKVNGEHSIAVENLMDRGSTVMIDIVASGMAAWVEEFGSGSLIDVTSPYFEQYKNSKYWNPARESKGNAFLGRKAGDTVYDLNGGSYTSSGGLEGLYLERGWLHGTQYREPYTPSPPMHIIQEEIKAEMPLCRQRLQQAIARKTQETILAQLSVDIYIK